MHIMSIKFGLKADNVTASDSNKIGVEDSPISQ